MSPSKKLVNYAGRLGWLGGVPSPHSRIDSTSKVGIPVSGCSRSSASAMSWPLYALALGIPSVSARPTPQRMSDPPLAQVQLKSSPYIRTSSSEQLYRASSSHYQCVSPICPQYTRGQTFHLPIYIRAVADSCIPSKHPQCVAATTSVTTGYSIISYTSLVPRDGKFISSVMRNPPIKNLARDRYWIIRSYRQAP